MWDIKFFNPAAPQPQSKKYYLNHVGYKVYRLVVIGEIDATYYLNHVGYKDEGIRGIKDKYRSII